MKKENDEIIELFRSRLEQAEMPVSDELWGRLENEIPVVMNNRRRIIYSLSTAASVLLVLAATSAAFWYLSPKEEIANAFTQMTIPVTPPATVGEDIIKAQYSPFAQSSSSVTSGHQPASIAVPVQMTEELEEESFSFSFSMSFSVSSSDEYEVESPGQGQVTYAGGGNERSGSHETKKETSVKQSSNIQKERTKAIGVWASTGLKATETGARHKMPLSVGVSMQKRISDRVALESGIAYTQLTSDLLLEGGKETQKLHAIGIPLKANVSLHETPRLSLYVSGGGMVEKYVSGPTDAFQASLTAGLGLQCKLSERLSLYAEPGVSYHFDNGSSVATLRKEKPFNVNLLCGVRMTY